MCLNDSSSSSRRTFACADCTLACLRRIVAAGVVHFLLRHAIRLDQFLVARRRNLRQILIRQRRAQIRSRLRKLLIHFRRIDVRQQFALLHPRPDVVIPLLQIAGRPRINRRFHIRLQRRRQHQIFLPGLRRRMNHRNRRHRQLFGRVRQRLVLRLALQQRERRPSPAARSRTEPETRRCGSSSALRLRNSGSSVPPVSCLPSSSSFRSSLDNPAIAPAQP